MHIFDVLEAWLSSMTACLALSGVIARFSRSPSDFPNPSCNLNLQRDDHEVDLVIWESGEAELVIGKVEGQVKQIHLADVRNPVGLTQLLSELVEFSVMSRSG